MTTKILPIIVADTGTHFQIYNPLNLDTYFVDKEDFFALATNKPLKDDSKSVRYISAEKESIDNLIEDFKNLKVH